LRLAETANLPEDLLTIPMGRAADPKEVSNLVLFLTSDESSYSTASEFVIDGGQIAGVPHKSL
jgi:3alpha(or 20beta)-hydroxysteroid dehydrogenase